MIRFTVLVCLSFFALSSPSYAFWFSLPDLEENLQVFPAPNKGDFGVYTPSGKKKVRLLIWNIYKGKKDNFSNDFSKFENDCDILMLQEAVSDGNFGDFLSSPFEHSYAFAVSFIYRRSGQHTGVATASRTPAHNHLKLESPYREIVGNTPKAALVSLYKYHPSKAPLMTVNVHAINSVTKRMFARHMDQLASVIKTHKGPVVWAGDFNTWSKRKTRYLMKLVKKIGLTEVKMSYGHKRMKVFGNYLDHIFVKKVQVNKAIVHHKSQGSDHKPMTLTVTLP